jgi:hypothetical protein
LQWAKAGIAPMLLQYLMDVIHVRSNLPKLAEGEKSDG